MSTTHSIEVYTTLYTETVTYQYISTTATYTWHDSITMVPFTTVWTPPCGIIFDGFVPPQVPEEEATCAPTFASKAVMGGVHYSPGICFSGYTVGYVMSNPEDQYEAPWSFAADETIGICVPVNFSVTLPLNTYWQSARRGSTSAPAWTIRFREADLAILETHPMTPGLTLNAVSHTENVINTGVTTATSRSATNSEPSTSSSSNKKLSGGAIAGIAVGTIAFVGIIAVLGVWFLLRHRRKRLDPTGADGLQVVQHSGSPPIDKAVATTSTTPVPVGQPPVGVMQYPATNVPGPYFVGPAPGQMPPQMMMTAPMNMNMVPQGNADVDAIQQSYTNPQQPYTNPQQPYTNPQQPYTNPQQPYMSPKELAAATPVPRHSVASTATDSTNNPTWNTTQSPLSDINTLQMTGPSPVSQSYAESTGSGGGEIAESSSVGAMATDPQSADQLQARKTALAQERAVLLRLAAIDEEEKAIEAQLRSQQQGGSAS